MQLLKIFRETFSETMLSHGFIYKNGVFIRVLEGEIVQALTVKSPYGHAYSFILSVFPIWLYRYNLFWTRETDISKPGAWEEGNEMTFNMYENFPYTDDFHTITGVLYRRSPINYYANDSESAKQVYANFQYAAEATKTLYFPILDKIRNFDNYVLWRHKETTLFSSTFLKYFIPVELLGYKAHVDGSPCWGIEQHKKDMRLFLHEKLLSFVGSSLKFEEILPDKGVALVHRWVEDYTNQKVSLFEKSKLSEWAYQILQQYENDSRKGRRARFWESVETGDFSWAVDYHDECLKEGTDLLKKSYPRLQGF